MYLLQIKSYKMSFIYFTFCTIEFSHQVSSIIIKQHQVVTSISNIINVHNELLRITKQQLSSSGIIYHYKATLIIINESNKLKSIILKHHQASLRIIREAFKKKPKKVWNFPNKGGGSRPIPNFFLIIFWLTKSIEKTLEMVWFIQKCKEKYFTFVGGGGVVPCIEQYCTIQNCTYSTLSKFGLQFFFISRWIRTYSFCFFVIWVTWKKTKILETFQTLGKGGGEVPEILEKSKLFGLFLKASLSTNKHHQAPTSINNNH